MSRPGLIVGLGGTGQWVLTWLKRDLMLANNGKLPDNVRLLSIDTATMLEAGAKRITASGQEEEGVEVGGVSLEPGEFIYIGGDSKPIAERIRLGNLPHIGKWYHAQRWLDTINPASFILDDGAGRIRQFGRMAIFKDLLGQEAGSSLWRAFRAALESVRAATNEQRRLEILVIGSFAGGTGSGMFLDVALTLRMLAQKLDVHHVLRGFFALPSVFTSAPDRDMRARTFAAWRELNRFMVIDSDFPMPRIEYVENNSSFQIDPSQRIFDACYLVDGKRNGMPLAEEARFGVFPMMAEVVSAILDDEAGQAYTQWVLTNLAQEYAKQPDVPLYSAVGAYTVQVPAHYVQELSSHQLGQDMLLALLKPRQKPDEFERLTVAGAERHLSLAAPNRNQEDKGYSGRQRSRLLLREVTNYNDEKARPSIFMGRIDDLLEQANVANQKATVVDDLARGQARHSWTTFYPDLGDDPAFEALKNEVLELTNYNVPRQYMRRDGEKADEARARMRRIPNDLRNRYGGISSSGEEVEEFYGAYGEALNKVQDVQLTIFRRIIRLRLLSILMGNSDDPIVARGGKLGYAWDFFDGVASNLESFLSLMRDVRKLREKIKPEIKLAGLSKQALRMMQATEGKKLLWFWEHPLVRGSEQGYLQAQQRLVEVRREDILHSYVIETAGKMRALALEARDIVQGWIWHLATGDDASSMPGIWDQMRRSKQEVKNAHAFDTETEKVQRLLQNQMLKAGAAELKDALSRWQWQVQYHGKPLQLDVHAEIKADDAAENPATLVNPIQTRDSELRMEIGKNQGKLLNLARRNFRGVVARSTVAQAIKDSYPNPETFAAQVAGVRAEPLFDGDPQASPRRKSNIIRVNSDNDSYFTGTHGLQGTLRYLNNLDRDQLDDSYGIQVVGSENPYKLTLVRTDDLYHYGHFRAWSHCIEAYEDHVLGRDNLLDPVLLHNFPAEAQAVRYERLLTQEPYSRPFRPLHPRVVMLLEDPAALRQFLYLGMLGYISEVEDDGQYRWELNWEKSSGAQAFWLTRGWRAEEDGNARPRPSIFNAMHGYIIMRRTQQPRRNDRIDTAFAERLIDQAIPDVDQQIKMLQENLEDDGWVGWLRSQAFDPNVPDRVSREDFRDLALISEILLKSHVQSLMSKKARKESVVDGRKGPFKVFRPSNLD